MYKNRIFLYGGKGLTRRGNTLYNRNTPKNNSSLKSLDNYLLGMIKGVNLQSKGKKKGSGAVKKYYAGSGLKFVR